MYRVASASVLAFLFALGCGGEQNEPEGQRPDLELLGGKADVPSWMRHIPKDFHCDSKVEGTYRGWDSAHLYSFPGKVGYEYTFRFSAEYKRYRGAVLAIYDAETGDRVAIERNSWSNEAKLTYKAERSVKYLVAVYSITWWARGDYTLSAECKRIETTCKSNADCDADQFCALENCGQGSKGLGTCAWRPQACIQLWDPVCGCDGRTYGSACNASSHNMSVAHAGECLQIVVDPSTVNASEPTTATLENTLKDPVYLGGCTNYVLQKEVNGKWTSQGPTRVCVWEGFAKKLDSGDAYKEQIVGQDAGTYRILGGYSLGCKDDVTLSQAKCRVSIETVSKPFTVKDNSCWGAWLDQNGACRTPADGVYPDACCDDKRMDFCFRINSEYRDALERARACSPVATAPQCMQFASTDLACRICTQAVQNTTELDAIAKRWERADCGKQPFLCAKYICAPPTGGICEADDGNAAQGTCQTSRP